MRWIIAGTHTLDSVIRVSTWHLVRYLAESPEAHRVLYLPAPISPLHFLLRPHDARFRERRPYWRSAPTAWRENAAQLTPLTLLPPLQGSPLDTPAIVRLSLRATLPPLSGILHRSGFSRPDILMISNLQYAHLDRIARPRRLVYRCVDDIRGFPGAPRSLAQMELDLLRRCDCCLATSRSLAEKLRERGARTVHVIRHGVDFDRFAAAPLPEPSDLAAIPHPRIIYVGTLSGWFHTEWVQAAARRLPDFHFLLVGPRESASAPLPAAPNIHVLGPRAPETISAYLHACDTAIIPFRPSPLVESVLPIKLYEYLAAGLPVVATRWKELEGLGAPIALADTLDSFIESLRPAPTESDRDQRIAFARANSWQNQFTTMMEILK